MKTLSRTVNVGVTTILSKAVQVIIPERNDKKVFLAICIGAIETVVLGFIFVYAKPTALQICTVSLFAVFTFLTLRNIRWGLNFFLLFIPIHLLLLSALKSYLSSDELIMFSLLKDILLFILFYCFVLGLLIKRIFVPASLISVLMALFIIVNLIFALHSPNLATSFYGARLQLEFMVMYFLAAGLLKTSKHIRDAIFCFLAGGAIVATYALTVLAGSTIAYGYEFGWLPYHIVGRLTVFGNVHTTNFFATYLSTVALMLSGFVLFYKSCLSKKAYLLLFVLFMICIVGIVYSFSRRAWVASFIAIMFISLLAKKLRFVVSMLLLLTIIVCAGYISSPKATGILYDRLLSISDPDSYYNISRIDEWKDLLIRAKNRSFLGEGLGMVGSIGSKLSIADSTNTHNYYLATLIQTGLVGLLSFGAIAIAALYLIIKAFLMARTPFLKAVTAGTAMAFISLLVQNMFGLTIEVYPFNLYYWFLIGLGVALFRASKDPSVKEQ